jgi:hypothetical protein
MRNFLHGRIQRFEQLLEAGNRLLHHYNDADPALSAGLLLFLPQAAGSYRSIGRQDIEGRILALQAEFITARRGIDPATLQRAVGRRRELENTTAFKVLQVIGEQLRNDLQQDEKYLQEGRVLLSQLMLVALQRRLLSVPVQAKRHYLQAEVDVFWHTMLADAEIGLAAQRVALMLNQHDIALLLQEMCNRLADA